MVSASFEGLIIRRERMAKSWSQDGLCAGICAVSYLSKIEKGKAGASREILALLMQRLEIVWHGGEEAARAAELAERFRREKKVVGFTNGCFDLLHLGHLHSFMKARKACDVLFVGLNTDASIKRLKGEDRPINNEEMRSLLLASLDFIDYVVPFDEDTALPLIEKLRPDVIAKEGYPLERWPEGQYVISYGGQALELPRLEGFSSTNIINRMKNSPE